MGRWATIDRMEGKMLLFPKILLTMVSVITLTLSRTVCFDPCEIEVTLRIEKASENKKVLIEVEGYDSLYFRSSEMEYSVTSPTTTKIRYMGIPTGSYVVRAFLYKFDGKEWSGTVDAREFKVIGDGSLTKNRTKKPKVVGGG